MLQQIRDKISGWFAWVFLGAIAVVFVFWGIRFESGPTAAAAKVNGESIPLEQVRRAWQQRQTELQQAARDELPAALVKAEQTKLLNEFIDREVLIQHVTKMGYRVSDLRRRPRDRGDTGTAGGREILARSLRGAAGCAGAQRGAVRTGFPARHPGRAAAQRHCHLVVCNAGRAGPAPGARGRDARHRLLHDRSGVRSQRRSPCHRTTCRPITTPTRRAS